jgi:serine/threonine-protein kinase
VSTPALVEAVEPECHLHEGRVAISARFGRYLVERELGRGGMGVVYAAYDDQLQRPVAIKTIAESVDDEGAATPSTTCRMERP